MTRPVLEPNAGHPITIEPTGARVTICINGYVIAETDAALTLQEANYPAVQYIPIADVVAQLTRSDTETYCPYKGNAGYYHVQTAQGETIDDAVWTYEEPFPAVSAIAGHVAFYPNKVDVGVGA
ncbi:MAG: DUF427 domain-containing protein [Mycobacterium sp.]